MGRPRAARRGLRVRAPRQPAGSGKVETDQAPPLQLEPTPTPTPSPTPTPTSTPTPAPTPAPTPTPFPVTGAYVQLNDVAKASGDSFSVRGSLTAAPGSDPPAAAFVTGVTVVVHETRAARASRSTA